MAIVGLLAIGIAEVVRTWSGDAPEYGQLLRSLLSRLPIVGALLWLGLHAGSKAKAAEQAEETYAHKEAISRSFEGYKKEFAALGDQVAADSPVANLCDRVLEVIGATTGRGPTDDKKDPTPVSAAAEAIGPIMDKAVDLVEAAAKVRR